MYLIIQTSFLKRSYLLTTREGITPILLTNILNLYTGYLSLSLIDCYVLTGILTCLRYIPSLLDTMLIHQSSL